ncbi:MAG: hypothetical protein WB786_08300 [Thermoplasmata archaeon]
MGRVDKTLVRQPWWRSVKPWIGIAWYRESGSDPGTFASDSVIVALNADQAPGGTFPHEIRVTVEWDEAKVGTPPSKG